VTPPDSTPPSALSDFEKLQFYRDEIKHEFGLLATRSIILVTCQSFLVVPFAILNTVANFRAALPSEYLVAALGLGTTIMLVQPIRMGERTLDMWLQKQRKLLRDSSVLRDLAIERDLRPGAETDGRADWEHRKSLAFSRYGPWAFIVFWVLAIGAVTVRGYLGV